MFNQILKPKIDAAKSPAPNQNEELLNAIRKTAAAEIAAQLKPAIIPVE